LSFTPETLRPQTVSASDGTSQHDCEEDEPYTRVTERVAMLYS
jgi:hypothetical protein